MAKQATGELRPLADGFEARIRIHGERRGFALAGFTLRDRERARERCTAMAAIVARLRRAGQESEAEQILKLAATVRNARGWTAIEGAVDALCGGMTAAASETGKPSFVAFAREWIDGSLHRRWPDHVPTKDSDADGRLLRKYVEPIVLDVAVDAFALDHAEQIMANLPEELGSSSRRHVAQFVRRVLQLAVYPARHRSDNPIPRGWLPKVRNARAFTHLYPEEDRALLGCTDVPLIRRLFFGVLAREGLRREELASLRWRDLNLAKGHIALDRNKTDDPRSWALDPAVARALAAWRERYRADADEGDDVFGEKGCSLYVNKMAAELRGDLQTAGVERETLYERSDVRRPIRVHDLRATFVTVSLANGKTETWVSDRTGHRSSEMVNRYRRAARTWSELNLGALGPLDALIPELGPLPRGLPQTIRGNGSCARRKAKKTSGEERIRTSGTLAGPHDFQSCTFDHSVTSPVQRRTD